MDYIVSNFKESLEYNLSIANFFMRKNYLDNLSSEKIKANLDDEEQNIGMVKIERLVYDDDAPANDTVTSLNGAIRM